MSKKSKGIKTNEDMINALFSLGILSSVYVIEALRVGLETYLNKDMISDEWIEKQWSILDTPEGVRAKMKTLKDNLENLQKNKCLL